MLASNRHQWAWSLVVVVAAGRDGDERWVMGSWKSHQPLSAAQHAFQNGTSQGKLLNGSKAFLKSYLEKGLKVNGKEAWARSSRKGLTSLGWSCWGCCSQNSWRPER